MHIDDLLNPYVNSYAGAVGNFFVLMDDNALRFFANIVPATMTFLGYNTDYIYQYCMLWHNLAFHKPHV